MIKFRNILINHSKVTQNTDDQVSQYTNCSSESNAKYRLSNYRKIQIILVKVTQNTKKEVLMLLKIQRNEEKATQNTILQ